MKKLVLPLAIVAALFTFGLAADTADAGGFGISVGHGGYGGHSAYYGGHGCAYGGGAVWHDTSHYDWHPASLRRHGNHFDYVPGHWDYHQTGHFDHFGW